MKPFKSDLRFLPSVLLVSADEQDHKHLQKILTPARYRVDSAETCAEAVHSVTRDRPAILVCDASLPDGGWKEILSQIAAIPDAPLLIVISTHADDQLWSEV